MQTRRRDRAAGQLSVPPPCVATRPRPRSTSAPPLRLPAREILGPPPFIGWGGRGKSHLDQVLLSPSSRLAADTPRSPQRGMRLPCVGASCLCVCLATTFQLGRYTRCFVCGMTSERFSDEAKESNRRMSRAKRPVP